MADRVDDDLILGCFVEDQSGIGRDDEAADRGIVRAGSDARVRWQQLDERAPTRLAPFGECDAR